MPGIGPLEILILLLVALVVFGPKRLPEMGRSLGRGMREFKDSISSSKEEPRAEPAPERLAPVPAHLPTAVVRDRDPAA